MIETSAPAASLKAHVPTGGGAVALDARSKEVRRWLEYLKAANMVAFEEIRAFDQVHEARRFCKCLSVGWFRDVTDLQIWNALRAMRADAALKQERGE